MDDHPLPSPEQETPVVAGEMRRGLRIFLVPLLALLDAQIDRRLVQTLLASVEAILAFRNRAHGLLLSELGAFLAGPDHAPAGTKRLSNLLRCVKWSAALIEDFLWQQAEARRLALTTAGEAVYAVWDESVLEKPESQATPDLCPVRSSKAGRLARAGGRKKPPSRPVFVPGLHWLGLLIVGQTGAPTLASMRWWTTRGLGARDKRTEEAFLLSQCVHAWGRGVLHLWDRGFAGTRWLGLALDAQVRFVLRWPKRYVLVDAAGRERPAWQVARGKRAWGARDLWDGRRHCWRTVRVLALPVTHPAYTQHLWLMVARRGGGESPWYLLTTESVQTLQEAWAVVLAYARRWQIELTWRYSKSELAMESPRVWTWERRHKLLLLATLAYAFLLSLLHPALAPLRSWLLRHWCHRTGRHCRAATAPLYRLRAALARLWLAAPRAAPPPAGQPLAP